MIEALSFQEAISGNHCYGCGPQNAKGFRIQSFWEGEESVCTWEPEPHHAAGPKDVLNGGVIATLIDCHCLCTVVAAAYREEGRQIGSSPIIWYVTGSLQVSYLKPTAINKPVTLRAKVQKTKPKKTIIECSLYSLSKETARAEVIAVRVPTGWLEGDAR